MIALIQRVLSAKVEISQQIVGEIGPGILIFLGIEANDNEIIADKLLNKVMNYRVFSDENQQMNLNVQQIQGSLLIVSQFTLVADTKKGNRPGFSSGASPEKAEKLYDYFIKQGRKMPINIQTGKFSADMKVSLENDGPVTFWLQVN